MSPQQPPKNFLVLSLKPVETLVKLVVLLYVDMVFKVALMRRVLLESKMLAQLIRHNFSTVLILVLMSSLLHKIQAQFLYRH